MRERDASKALTSAAAGLLLEKGRLKLDDKIQTYVPAFPEKQWPVTLRQLMGHLAGVTTDGGDEGPLFSVRCERPVEGLPFFAKQSLLFEPGTQYRYSSYGWILVSAAVEAAADEPFLRFLRKQIFEPLGMDDTKADSATEPIPDRATFYFPRFAADPRYGLHLMRQIDYIVKKHFGDVPLSAITASTIADFQRARHAAGIANRTINMDVGVLSRVLKFSGRWRALADHVHNLPERQRPIGRALTGEERRRLFETAASNPEWEHVYCAAIVAANTSMRPVEVKHIRRCDVDLVKRLVHVRRSKNETSHRVIPLTASAIEAAARMFERADLLGHTESGHYLWPACQWGQYDPTKPMLKWDTAWRALRDEAGLHGLRFHDLRHTVITEPAEMGVPDHVLESISGHLSRRMLEHYSHIRIDAKRQALDALDNLRRGGDAGNGNGKPANDAGIATIVEVGDDLTSQSRHSLLLSGSPPSGKLLIPLERRDVRVVEGARLESDSGDSHRPTAQNALAHSLQQLAPRKCSSV